MPSSNHPNDRNKRHALVSAGLMGRILPDWFLKQISPELYSDMVEAISNHHKDFVNSSCTDLAIALKDSDGKSASESTGLVHVPHQAVAPKVNEESLPEQAVKQQTQDDANNDRDITRFLTIVKRAVLGKNVEALKRDYHFFIFKGINSIGIVNNGKFAGPWVRLRKAFAQEFGSADIDDASIIALLNQRGLITLTDKKGNEFGKFAVVCENPTKPVEHNAKQLNMVMLRLDEIFSQEEIADYKSYVILSDDEDFDVAEYNVNNKTNKEENENGNV